AEPYIEFPARVSGNDCFTAFPGVNDWYETVKLNYGIDFGDGSRHFDPVPDTWYKMVNILLYWAGKGVDGFRCDMAHMVPVEFWAWAISIVREQFPKVIFIAEIYDTGLYYDYIHRAGFDYLYDKVNLYDTLRGIQTGNVSAAQLTNAWQRIDGLGPHMLNFLENHDEQRFGSPQYAGNPALVTPSLVVSTFFSTGPMMVYMAQELGEQALDAEGFSGKDGRTTIFDYWSMPTTRRWLATGAPDNDAVTPDEQRLRKLYATVMNLANSEKAIAEGGFFDLMYVNYDNPSLNPHRHYTFLRHAGDDIILVAVNFDDSDAHLRINIPAHAFATMGVVQAEKPVAALDLLTSEKAPKNFRADMTFDTEVKAHGAVAWKIKNPAKSTKAKITKKASTSKKKS
ncbi:MAG: alpha-amylase, partial [Muribaculaceae bacterium]|nr:alpha-amylase [Muribaculaceae bacterium]